MSTEARPPALGKTTPKARRGQLSVTLLGANGLLDSQYFGRQDPFCIVQVGSRHFTTEVASDAGKNPVWNARFNFEITNEDTVHFTIRNRNVLTSDASLGSAQYSLAKVFAEGKDDTVIPVFTPTNRQHGTISVILLFAELGGKKPKAGAVQGGSELGGQGGQYGQNTGYLPPASPVMPSYPQYEAPQPVQDAPSAPPLPMYQQSPQSLSHQQQTQATYQMQSPQANYPSQPAGYPSSQSALGSRPVQLPVGYPSGQPQSAYPQGQPQSGSYHPAAQPPMYPVAQHQTAYSQMPQPHHTSIQTAYPPVTMNYNAPPAPQPGYRPSPPMYGGYQTGGLPPSGYPPSNPGYGSAPFAGSHMYYQPKKHKHKKHGKKRHGKK